MCAHDANIGGRLHAQTRRSPPLKLMNFTAKNLKSMIFHVKKYEMNEFHCQKSEINEVHCLSKISN